MSDEHICVFRLENSESLENHSNRTIRIDINS